jgi:glycosyltransferase involved in cell wall biosynthesis
MVISFGLGSTRLVDDDGVSVWFIEWPESNSKSQYANLYNHLDTIGLLFSSHLNQNVLPHFFPDLVHAHEWIGFHASSEWRRQNELPMIVTHHALWLLAWKYLIRHPRVEQLAGMERTSCTDSDRVIAVSHALATELNTFHQIDPGKVDVIYNGFDMDEFTSILADQFSREAFQARMNAGQQRVIAYAGRLAPHKGVATLLRSAAQVVRLRDDVRYLIAGELEPTPYAESLRQLVLEDPLLQERVQFLGKVPRSDLPLLYDLASIAVVPSIYEPFGYAATEAMAAGCPVIAVRTGGLGEIIEDGVSGLLVPLCEEVDPVSRDVDLNALVNAQLRLLDESDRGARMGNAGRQRVRESFSLKDMVKQTLSVYQSTIQRGAQTAFPKRDSKQLSHLG